MAQAEKSQSETQKRLATLRDRVKAAIEAYGQSRQYQVEDMKFFAGDSDNKWQWPSEVVAVRSASQGQSANARPCLTVNKLPQHVRQITNDQRQNRPGGRVIPANDKADVKVAEVYDGMIRHIEYMSDADVAYDTACENQVASGEGYIRILTDYCEDDSFDQDIKIGRVRNPFAVFLDPSIQDPCGADAEWGVILSDMMRDTFEREYPKATPLSSIESMCVGDNNLAAWITDKSVRVAEYYYAVYQPKKIALFANGEVAEESEPRFAELKAVYGKPVRERTAQKRIIKYMKTNGYDTLEESEWAGKWIPIIRVVGNEFEIDGKLSISGIVRNAKDAQRMYNYWVSQEAEMLALAPKAPFIGYAGQFEGYENQWKTANTSNWPYLEVNTDVADAQGNPLPLPQRAQPPMAQSGLIAAKMGASDDIKSATGQYDSSLGATSNERSGRAILERERQSDTGSYHYVDNLARAVRYVTRQIVDLIPKIYDAPRVARIIGIDQEVSMVDIDPTQPEPVREIKDDQGIVIKKIYNPGIGKYDVIVTTGPSYMTKRQQAMDAMGQILQGNPELWAVAGDLFVKNMDWPGAQELSARLRKSIDPKLLEDQDDPALAAAKKQMEEMAQQMQAMQQMLQNVQNSIEVQELEVKQYDAETKRMSAIFAVLADMADKGQQITSQSIQQAMKVATATQSVAQPVGQ